MTLEIQKIALNKHKKQTTVEKPNNETQLRLEAKCASW